MTWINFNQFDIMVSEMISNYFIQNNKNKNKKTLIEQCKQYVELNNETKENQWKQMFTFSINAIYSVNSIKHNNYQNLN